MRSFRLKSQYKTIEEAKRAFVQKISRAEECNVILTMNCVDHFFSDDCKAEEVAREMWKCIDAGLEDNTDICYYSTTYRIAGDGNYYGECIDEYEEIMGDGDFGKLVAQRGGGIALHLVVVYYCEQALIDFIDFAFDGEETEENAKVA